MGCGSSAALASASQIQTLRTKDAGSQTNVTVLVSATPESRTEAHDARKELIMQHRSQALAKAQELSNSKSGYNTATYTGSGMSTPRSAYSRTQKFRGSLGSLSDCDLKSRSEVLTVDINNSRTNLSDRSSNVRRTQVSFRNEEYNRMATANVKKRRRSYLNQTKTPTTILRKGRRVSVAGSNHSESSGTNSINKQADTGYDGSVSSGPSQSTLTNAAGKSTSDHSNPSNISTKPSTVSTKPSGDLLITQTLSNETNPGRLSVVVSIDEQSILHDAKNSDQANADSSKNIADGLSHNLSLQDTTAGEQLETVKNIPCEDVPQVDPLDEKGVHNSDNGSLETDKTLSNPDHLDLDSGNRLEKPIDTPLTNGLISDLPGTKLKPFEEPATKLVNGNVIIVTASQMLVKSDSVSSIKKVVNISTSSQGDGGGLTAIE
ncbi:pre-mRNA-splicing factor CWC22 homolog [Bolinopsis microptera]|uniref:pre-mRNA-splicing factor CWC22 homolog n=1 Tax=Bolinopsis microptera TaxID=2820187 RepID=UPI00307A6829